MHLDAAAGGVLPPVGAIASVSLRDAAPVGLRLGLGAVLMAVAVGRMLAFLMKPLEQRVTLKDSVRPAPPASSAGVEWGDGAGG